MLMALAVIIGIIAFLVMEHTLAFWLIFVPLALLFVFFYWRFIFGRGSQISSLLAAMGIFVTMIISLAVICLI